MKEDQPTAGRFYRSSISRTRQKLADYDERGIRALNPHDKRLVKFPGGPEALLELSKTVLSDHISLYMKLLTPLENKRPSRWCCLDCRRTTIKRRIRWDCPIGNCRFVDVRSRGCARYHPAMSRRATARSISLKADESLSGAERVCQPGAIRTAPIPDVLCLLLC